MLYGVSFVALALFNAALYYHRHQAEKPESTKESITLAKENAQEAVSKFKRQYFSPYGLVMAADWLQGPYIYTLYKDEKSMSESTVAALFTTGFVAAGITASFVGSLADQNGRRSACLLYCVTYSLSCLSVLSDDALLLFVGRALGGFSTTLQYSVFESWMVSEYHGRDLKGSLALGSLFSLSVTLSGFIAIVAGVVGEALVEFSGTKTSPFLLAIVCLAAAFALIQQTWTENYGETVTEHRWSTENDRTRRVLSDKRILALGLTTTIFEGSIFLFVFFWSPAIISARITAEVTSPPPFGLIFSNFMCAMMLGSLVFSLLKPQETSNAAMLMLSIFAICTWAILTPVLLKGESTTFWSFALFEVCVGVYFPTTSQLKSDIVEDAVRAKVYSWMRLPLNVFVVVALGLTEDGDEHRLKIFSAIGTLMLVAFWIVHRYLV